MRTTYLEKDVILLLKEVTGLLEPLDTKEREKKIQSGVHYSEMLPLEYKPTSSYMALYQEALKNHGAKTAMAVKTIAEKILDQKGNAVVLVSLARAGTPIGILIKRYLYQKYQLVIPHYTISIIRGKGIDKNAINYLLSLYKPEQLQFVDGWIGKGAIIKELKKETAAYEGLSGELAVLADPARLTTLYGTSEDFLIPSACLNATVSGLFSRTILNHTILDSHDFHGAVYFEELEKDDVSYEFIDTIEKQFEFDIPIETIETQTQYAGDVERVAKEFQIENINFIKPGIGETTRVLLRRQPYKILVRDRRDELHIGHIKRLCEEKEVEIIEYPLQCYRACGIIKNLNADV